VIEIRAHDMAGATYRNVTLLSFYSRFMTIYSV